MVKKKEWRSWGMSVIGKSHIKLNIKNQDAWLSKSFYGGDVVVVADGLGSHKYSDRGSIAICKAILSIAKIYSHLKYINIERLLKRIHSKWIDNLKKVSANEASTTVLFVIQYRKETIVCQLGDGMIMGFYENKNSFIMQENKEELFSNTTHSLREKFDVKYWKIKRFQANTFKTFILSTDGISDDLKIDDELKFGQELYQSQKKYSKIRIERNLRDMLMNWPVPNHSDDKTIACLYRR